MRAHRTQKNSIELSDWRVICVWKRKNQTNIRFVHCLSRIRLYFHKCRSAVWSVLSVVSIVCDARSSNHRKKKWNKSDVIVQWKFFTDSSAKFITAHHNNSEPLAIHIIIWRKKNSDEIQPSYVSFALSAALLHIWQNVSRVISHNRQYSAT